MVEAYMSVYAVSDEKKAQRAAQELKEKPEIKEYIEKELKGKGERRVDTNRILELLEAIAFTSPADFAGIINEGGKQKIIWHDTSRLPKAVKSAIATIKNTPSGISIETLDRMKAISLLMKYTGLDRSEGGPVIFEGEDELGE